MEAKDIPFFVALIFPGFFAIQAFFWATQSHRIPDLPLLLWSFVFSVPVFFGIHGVFRHIAQLEASLPKPQTITNSASEAPVWFLVALYVGAVLGAYVLGLFWRTKLLDAPLRVVGMDLRRHRDLLGQALEQNSYVDIKVGNALFRGWPVLSSTEEHADRFVYLIRAKRKKDDGSWTEGERQVLIPLKQIERIYFLDPRRPLVPPEEEGHSNIPPSTPNV